MVLPDGTKVVAIAELSLYVAFPPFVLSVCYAVSSTDQFCWYQAPSPAVLEVDVGLRVNGQDVPTRELKFSYYRPFSFHDFHPKAGNLNGGTEIHVYGSNFIDHPHLLCLFELVYSEVSFQILKP